ncbi:periplasmic protein [Rhodovulum sp. PH10]|nr:periplasmic protein [Rhodovulum sp. PH10]
MSFMSRLLCLCLAMAVPIAATPARAQQTTEVRVAVLAPSALLWLHAIARDQGFYAERHIAVKELIAGSSPALLQAVSSGSVEAGISLGDIVIRAIDQGAPVVMSGAVLGKTILRLVGGTGIDQAKQLDGKTVTAGAVEGGTANLLRFQLDRLGVDPRGVKMVALTNSRDRVVALGNGQVQGALLIAPFDTLAVEKGMKILDVYKEPYVQTPLILNKPWAESHRQAAVGLTKALQKAANWIYDPANKQKAIDILAAYTKIDPAICEKSYQFIVEEQQAVAKNLEVTAAGLKNIIEIDQAVSVNPASTKAFELSRYYDPSYLTAE